MKRSIHWIGRGIGGAVAAASLLFAGTATADNESCREWRKEHRVWKTESLRRYLRGAPQREVESAVFEVLQREAYLTSCEVSVRTGRDELVGWRLVDRTPEEYGGAVADAVLQRAGFDLSLTSVFAKPPARVVKKRSTARARYVRGVRPR